jgi:release factor glutamine methyltransferase
LGWVLHFPIPDEQALYIGAYTFRVRLFFPSIFLFLTPYLFSMTIQEASAYISESLTKLYPEQEIRGFTNIILDHLTGLSRTNQLLSPGLLLTQKSEEQMYNIIEQLKLSKPIQYIIGKCWFFDLIFEVSGSVLIPRPETEELVDWIIKDNTTISPSILDIGTGSGCIAVSLAKNISGKVSAVDVSAEALYIARRNASANNTNVEFFQIDILTESIPGPFDIIVSNPPYVTLAQKKEMHSNVLDYEPHLALFVPEDDPLLFYRVIASFASKNLKSGGKLFFEINEELPQQTEQLVADFGFETELRKDLNGKYRMLKAVRND